MFAPSQLNEIDTIFPSVSPEEAGADISIDSISVIGKVTALRSISPHLDGVGGNP